MKSRTRKKNKRTVVSMNVETAAAEIPLTAFLSFFGAAGGPGDLQGIRLKKRVSLS